MGVGPSAMTRATTTLGAWLRLVSTAKRRPGKGDPYWTRAADSTDSETKINAAAEVSAKISQMDGSPAVLRVIRMPWIPGADGDATSA